MNLQKNISLKSYNTFGIKAFAKLFGSFTTVNELEELIAADSNRLILGGGSNILFTTDFNGIVLKNEIHGIEVIKEDDEHIFVRCGAGENWHRFVMYCIDNNYAGVENLSLIPGNTGASPMQNIGAYGVELKDVFYELEAFHINERTVIKF
jgi:UDP-N-acetylmuramate dehydrogenase